MESNNRKLLQEYLKFSVQQLFVTKVKFRKSKINKTVVQNIE